MDIQPIRTEAEHAAAIEEIAALMASDPQLGTPEGDRLDALVKLVQGHERKHFPIGAADPMTPSSDA
jgi:HTH-type transcriptional regulator / antitoxin HigA